MDLSKIFLKGACPTKMGGQAVMEGIMMRGETKTALALRLPDGSINVSTEDIKKPGKWAKLPLVRGVVSFVSSLVVGIRQLMKSAEILGEADEEMYEETRFEKWLNAEVRQQGRMEFHALCVSRAGDSFHGGHFHNTPDRDRESDEACAPERILAQLHGGRAAYRDVHTLRMGHIVYGRYKARVPVSRGGAQDDTLL